MHLPSSFYLLLLAVHAYIEVAWPRSFGTRSVAYVLYYYMLALAMRCKRNKVVTQSRGMLFSSSEIARTDIEQSVIASNNCMTRLRHRRRSAITRARRKKNNIVMLIHKARASACAWRATITRSSRSGQLYHGKAAVPLLGSMEVLMAKLGRPRHSCVGYRQPYVPIFPPIQLTFPPTRLHEEDPPAIVPPYIIIIIIPILCTTSLTLHHQPASLLPRAQYRIHIIASIISIGEQPLSALPSPSPRQQR